MSVTLHKQGVTVAGSLLQLCADMQQPGGDTSHKCACLQDCVDDIRAQYERDWGSSNLQVCV